MERSRCGILEVAMYHIPFEGIPDLSQLYDSSRQTAINKTMVFRRNIENNHDSQVIQ